MSLAPRAHWVFLKNVLLLKMHFCFYSLNSHWRNNKLIMCPLSETLLASNRLFFLPGTVAWFEFLCLFLFIQVINGLMEREDWQEAIQTPLGILPGGSGNALAASVHHYSQWVSPLMSHLNAWSSSSSGEGGWAKVDLKNERFISSLFNYGKGWLGTSVLRRKQTETASLCRRGHSRWLITLKGMM